MDRAHAPHLRAKPSLSVVGLLGLVILYAPAPFLSLALTWLTLWVWQQMLPLDQLHRGSFFLSLAYALLGICVGFFHVGSTWGFYILFERSLLPTLLIILLFGYQPEKLQAGQYLLLYTVLASLPLLFSLLTQTSYLGWLAPGAFTYLGVTLTLGFIVKRPLYLVHIWLPKAHVEAPVAARIALAGVLLKLGSFGLFLFCPFLIHPVLLLYIRIRLLGSIACSLICTRQWDAKRLIAFSSVVHMGVVTVGVAVGREIGYLCAVIIVIAHGVCSPLLFALAYRYYLVSHSRLLTANRGRLSAPLAVLGLFFLLAVNIGVPPFLNLWREVLIFAGLLCYAAHALWVLLPVAFLSALYNLFMYVRVVHGKEGTMGGDWGELWPGVHSVGLSLLLAGGMGLCAAAA